MAFSDIHDFVQAYADKANDMNAGPEKKYPFEIEDGSGSKRRFVVCG